MGIHEMAETALPFRNDTKPDKLVPIAGRMAFDNQRSKMADFR